MNDIEELTEGQVHNVKLFHKERTAFALVSVKGKDGERLVFNDREGDIRGHKLWLNQDFGIDDVAFENVVRGYIDNSTIQFYIGNDFKAVAEERISLMVLQQLVARVKARDKSDYIWVYNGRHIGEAGEKWKPIERLFVIYTK